MASSIFTTTRTTGAFPDAQFIKPAEALPEAICFNEAVATQSVIISGDAPRVNIPYVDTDPTANVVAEGAEIAQSETTLNQITIATHKIAIIIPFSNESLRYSDAAALVEDGATRAMTNKADNLFLSAAVDTTAGTPAGIANLDGLTTETPTKLNDLSPVLNVLAKTTDNGANPTGIVMRYSTWARLMGLTAADGRPFIEPDVTTSAAPVLFNVPVIFNSQAPADTILTLSAKDIIVSASMIEAATSTDALFSKDSSLMRLTMRLGYGVIHPNRLGRVVLPPVTSGTSKG